MFVINGMEKDWFIKCFVEDMLMYAQGNSLILQFLIPLVQNRSCLHKHNFTVVQNRIIAKNNYTRIIFEIMSEVDVSRRRLYIQGTSIFLSSLILIRRKNCHFI